ncbi:hypothetical protein M514_03974 [Trichuris suis]|uniref:Uncharacterized protein n=1 Tax=Trichuris suis TaxID=68888 RepID=A0A085NSZ0_9BILA|nr:hypothetical protein M513_03974 [Trichuris suis]KFD72586.1 hypothetical protein M514_03974 [Trichuris suis]
MLPNAFRGLGERRRSCQLIQADAMIPAVGNSVVDYGLPKSLSAGKQDTRVKTLSLEKGRHILSKLEVHAHGKDVNKE